MVLQLDLSNNKLCGIHDDYGHGTYNAEGITAIADALRVNGGLTSLNLSSNGIGGYWDDDQETFVFTLEGPKAIADALLVNGALTALNLSNNYLNSESVSAVCEAIQSNKETKLASLNMGKNRFGPVGAKSVAAMVAVTGALTKLSLAKNELGEVGTKAICEALEQNKTLKELDISGSHNGSNIGGSAGAKHVAKMLGVNGALTKMRYVSPQT